MSSEPIQLHRHAPTHTNKHAYATTYRNKRQSQTHTQGHLHSFGRHSLTWGGIVVQTRCNGILGGALRGGIDRDSLATTRHNTRRKHLKHNWIGKLLPHRGLSEQTRLHLLAFMVLCFDAEAKHPRAEAMCAYVGAWCVYVHMYTPSPNKTDRRAQEVPVAPAKNRWRTSRARRSSTASAAEASRLGAMATPSR